MMAELKTKKNDASVENILSTAEMQKRQDCVFKLVMWGKSLPIQSKQGQK